MKKILPNTPPEDKYSKEILQPDDEIIIPQDDLYTISWEADFDYQFFEPRRDGNANKAAQTPDSNANIATGDYVFYDKANDDAVKPRPATSRDEIILHDEDDVNEIT